MTRDMCSPEHIFLLICVPGRGNTFLCDVPKHVSGIMVRRFYYRKIAVRARCCFLICQDYYRSGASALL